jgi:methyl-accepting chemotaxis protein
MSTAQPNRRKIVNIQSDWRALVFFALPFFILLLGPILILQTVQYKIVRALEAAELAPGKDSQVATLVDVLGEVTKAGVLGLVALGIVAVVLWIVLARRIFGPAVQFKRHIESLTQGDYTSRVQLRRGDEFKDVAEKLNELAEALAQK